MVKFISFFTVLPVVCSAATITNAIQGFDAQGKSRPYICVQNQEGKVTLPLAPDASGDVNKASGNPFYATATLRLGGCSIEHTYLGLIQFSRGKSGASIVSVFEPPSGMQIDFVNKAINAKGSLQGNILYQNPSATTHLIKTQNHDQWQFKGINTSALEVRNLKT